MIQLGDLCVYCCPRVTVTVKRGKYGMSSTQQVLFVGNAYDLPAALHDDIVSDIKPVQTNYMEILLFDDEMQKELKS